MGSSRPFRRPIAWVLLGLSLFRESVGLAGAFSRSSLRSIGECSADTSRTFTFVTRDTSRGSMPILHRRDIKRSVGDTRLRSSSDRESDATSSTAVVVERPDPEVLLSARDSATQKVGFVAIVGVLAVGTFISVQALTFLEQLLPSGWFDAWRYYTWTFPMGATFVAAGISHFALKDTFTSFVPPPGTWGGLWQVPAPGADKLGLSYEEYHSYWTGVAEIGGGMLLVLSGFPFNAPFLPTPIPAFLLFLLTCAVTPANIYMFTHDIQPPRLPPIPYPEGHIFRGVMQCVLLSIFWKLAFQ